jgi:hypothetical protein
MRPGGDVFALPFERRPSEPVVPSSVPPCVPLLAAPRVRVVVRRCVLAARAPCVWRYAVIHVAAHVWRHERAWATADALRDVRHATQIPHSVVFVMSHWPAAEEASHPRVAPWRDRWRSPASLSGRHACPRERDGFPRERTHPLVSLALSLVVWLCARARASSVQA